MCFCCSTPTEHTAAPPPPASSTSRSPPGASSGSGVRAPCSRRRAECVSPTSKLHNTHKVLIVLRAERTSVSLQQLSATPPAPLFKVLLDHILTARLCSRKRTARRPLTPRLLVCVNTTPGYFTRCLHDAAADLCFTRSFWHFPLLYDYRVCQRDKRFTSGKYWLLQRLIDQLSGQKMVQ